MKNFQKRLPTERKNNFHDKLILKTCSVTSNYPWKTLSPLWDTYSGLQIKKFQKIEQSGTNTALFGGDFLQTVYESFFWTMLVCCGESCVLF